MQQETTKVSKLTTLNAWGSAQYEKEQLHPDILRQQLLHLLFQNAAAIL